MFEKLNTSASEREDLLNVLFSVTYPSDWPEEKVNVMKGYVTEAIDGAEKWLKDALARVDTSLDLERS